MSTLTIDCSLHVIASANVPSPVIAMYWLPSGRLPRIAIMTFSSLSHRCDSSCRQNQHVPHAGMNAATMWSPALTLADFLADFEHGARALVAEDRAGHDADVAVLQRQVGVADAAGAELDDDVAGAGRRGLDVLDRERPSGFGEHCGPHGRASWDV